MNFYVSPFLFLPHGQDRRLQVAGGLLLQSFSAYFGTCPINGTRGSTIEITWMNVEREREGMGVTLGTHNQDWNLKRGREGVITNSTKEIMLGTHWICHHNPALNGRGNLTLACRLHEELTLFFFFLDNSIYNEFFIAGSRLWMARGNSLTSLRQTRGVHVHTRKSKHSC